MASQQVPALAPALDAPAAGPSIDVVVPVYDEVGSLASSITYLHRYLLERFPFSFRVTIADNGSSDGTWELAQQLERELAHVRALRLDEKGRGRALHRAWSESDASVFAYMDVDLSTD